MLQPTDLTEKYVTMSRAADAGAIDGANGWPPHDAKNIAKTEREIVNLAENDLKELTGGQKEKNDAALARIRGREGRLPFDLGHRAEEFLTKAETKVVEVDRLLVRLYRERLDRERDYRFFKAQNRLNREATPAPSLYVALAWLSLALVLDGGLNAYFFKDVGPLGLVGGFLIAFVISACNIAIGFLVGWGPARFFAHRYKLHLLWSVPVFLALLIATVLFNLGTAHYRDLVVHSPDIEVGAVLDDLYRNVSRVPSFQSCLMAIVGIGVAVFAAIKGHTMLDAYPFYGAAFKRMRAAQDEFDGEIETIQGRINKEASGYLSDARSQYEEINSGLQAVLDDYEALISSNDLYVMGATDIENACQNALDVYREQNLRVRDKQQSPPPGHFFEKWTLPKRADIFDREKTVTARDQLKVRQTELRRASEALEREVPKMAAGILSERNLKSRLEEVMRQAELDDAKEQDLRKQTRPDG